MSKIRLSRFPQPQTRTPAVTPNNYGLHEHANYEIERTIQVSNERYDEALKTDGVQVMVWRRTNRGFVCSCQSDPSTGYHSDNPEQTHTAPGHSEPNPAASPSDGLIRVRGSRDLETKNVYHEDRVLGVDVGEPDDENGRGTGFENVIDGPGTDGDGAKFLDQSDLRSFIDGGVSTTTCGICFGTGYTDGYTLYGGQRIVLESHNLADNDGFSISDEPDAPLTYSGNEGSVLTWSVNIPTFFKAAWITARNNIKSTVLDIKINDAEVPLDGLKSFKGQTVKLTATALTDDTEITHIELVFQFAEWPYTQIDNIIEDLSRNAPESTQTLDFPFSPKVQRLGREDVFVDFKYNKVWRVNSVTDYKTNVGTVVTWQASATSRTQFDVLSLLKVALFPDYEVSFRDLQY